MKNWKSKAILLLMVILLSFVGATLTYAVLKTNTSPLANRFTAANVYHLKYHINNDIAVGDDAFVDEQRAVTLLSVFSHTFDVTEITPTREGYTFLGWADDPDATEADYNVDSADKNTITVTTDTPSPNITKVVYAVWKNTDITYTLTYKLNAEGVTLNGSTYLEDVKTSTENHYDFPAKSLPDNINPGYVFLGWADDSTSAHAQYSPGSTIRVTYDPASNSYAANKEVFAVWGEDGTYLDFTVDFDLNLPEDIAEGTVGSIPGLSAKDNSTEYSFIITQTPTVKNFDDNGLTFVGWATSPDGFAEYFPENSTSNTVTVKWDEEKAAASTTLYAVWERIYYVSYVGNATNPPAVKYDTSTNVQQEDTAPIVSSSTENEISVIGHYEKAGQYYKRRGYVLVGFATDPDSRTPVENIKLTAAGKNNATSLYAIWTEGTYALSYEANGGSGAPATQFDNQAVTSYTFTIQKGDALAPHAGAINAVFLGWAFDEEASTPDFAWDSTTETFTPATITLTENDPSDTLHAVWLYEYILSFDKGYGDEGTSVPSDSAAVYSTAKNATIDMPAIAEADRPTRASYEFLGYWSDELNRKNGENRYYDKSYGEDFLTTVELDYTNTHKTIYARFDPLDEFVLNFSPNGGSLPTSSTTDLKASITKPDTDDWQCVFVLPTDVPTKDYNTFVGWAESPDADYTWLYSNDPDKRIYGGNYVSGDDQTYYVLNGDISVEQTLYAVWGPDHYISVSVNYNGGTAWYQGSESYLDGCTTKYRWVSSTNVTAPGTSWGRVVKFDEYYNSENHKFTVTKVGGDSVSNSNYSGKSYVPRRDNMVIRGFDTSASASDPAYTTAKGNLTMTASSTKSSSGASASSGSFKHSGIFTISNVVVDMDTASCSEGTYGNGGNRYSITLYALWKSTVDYYRIVAVDPSNNNQTVVLKGNTPVTLVDGQESQCIFAAGTVESPFKRSGYICDFSYTPNATTPDLTVTDTWVTNSNVSTDDVAEVTKISPYQRWWIDSEITVKPGGPNVTVAYDDNLLSDVYTLTLYPVWQAGRIFTLVINSPRDSGGTMGSKYFFWPSWDNYNTHTTDSISATARATESSYTWAAGKAGEFYPAVSNSNYYFMGYSYTSGGRGNVDFTVKSRTTELIWNIVIDYKNTQPWYRIEQEVRIDSNDTARVVTAPNGAGIPVSTMNLYAVWHPYKTFSVIFNENGGNFGHLESDYKSSSEINLISSGHEYTETAYTFTSSGSNDIYTPRRRAYELLGYTYEQKAPVDEAVDPDLHLIPDGNSTTLYYLQEDITVSDSNADYNPNVVPHQTKLTVYALWQRFQEYSVTFDFNGGNNTSSTVSENVEIDVTQHEMRVKPAVSTTNGDYTLLGYTYRNDIAPGLGTVDDVVFAPDEDGYYTIPIERKNDASTNTTTTYDESTDLSDTNVTYFTNKTLYAVWGTDVTYFRIRVRTRPDLGDSSPVSNINRTDSGLTDEYILSSASISSLASSRPGYRLAYLKYQDETGLTDQYTVSGSTITDPITIKAGAPGVTTSTQNNANLYILDLDAVWIKQDLYEVVIHANDGKLLNASGSYTTDSRIMDISGSRSYSTTLVSADTGSTDPVVVDTATVTVAATSSPIATRSSHTFQSGFSHTTDSEVRDYSVTRSSNLGSTSSPRYEHSISSITIDKNDTTQHITERTHTDSNGDEFIVYTLNLYPTWKRQQHFELILNPNSGTFTNSSGTIRENIKTSASAYYADDSYKFSGYAFTDYNDIYSMYPGYTLLGFSYAVDGEIDIPITASSDRKKVTLGAVTINKADTEGKTISVNPDSDPNANAEIETTTLTVYAVWGIQLDYADASEVPDTLIRLKPAAITERTFDIAAFKPANGKYTFLGWATESGGSAKYGVEGYYLQTTQTLLPHQFTFPVETGHQTLYAVWAQRYELRYAANGGNEASVPVNVFSYSTAKTDALTVSNVIPTRDGYTFLGWADNPTDSVPKYSATDPNLAKYVTITGASDGGDTIKTIYAVWTSDTEPAEKAGSEETVEKSASPTEGGTPPAAQEWKYELRYDANGGDKATVPDKETGSSTEDKVSVTVKFRNKDSDPLPARAGYTFLGWAEKADAQQPQYLDGALAEIVRSEKETSVLTLYAVWEKNADPEEPDEGDDEDPTPPDEGDDEDPTPPDEGDGEDPTPPDEGDDEDPTPPDEGDDEDPTPPDEGDDEDPTPPTSGDDVPAPTSGDDVPAPTSGDSSPAPANNVTPPTDGGDEPPPSGGGDDPGTGGEAE